jgi:hypothetical protein
LDVRAVGIVTGWGRLRLPGRVLLIWETGGMDGRLRLEALLFAGDVFGHPFTLLEPVAPIGVLGDDRALV